jgi:hypothetical protein
MSEKKYPSDGMLEKYQNTSRTQRRDIRVRTVCHSPLRCTSPEVGSLSGPGREADVQQERGGYLDQLGAGGAGTRRLGTLVRHEKWKAQQIDEFLLERADQQLEQWEA